MVGLGKRRRLDFEGLERRQLLTTIVVDFDGDHDVDVLYQSSPGRDVDWFENVDGFGTFEHHELRFGRARVAMGDADKDGDLDFATPTHWYENQSGELTQHALPNLDLPASALVRRLSIDDGTLNLVHSDGFVTLDRAEASSDFQIVESISFAQIVGNRTRDGDVDLVSDIDGDGDVDALVRSQQDFFDPQEIRWYENRGGGEFQAGSLVALVDPLASPESMTRYEFEMLDVDGDQDDDLVAHSQVYYTQQTWVRLNDGGAFGEIDLLRISETSEGADYQEGTGELRDVDMDGDADLLIDAVGFLRPGEGTGDYWLRNDNMSFTSCDCTLTIDDMVAFGDINSDGVPDGLQIVGSTTKELRWHDGRASTPLGKMTAIQEAVRTSYRPSNVDFNDDGVLSDEDIIRLLDTELDSVWGDANFDGRFDTADIVQVFARGEYEDSVAQNSGWDEGDWNGDGEFDSADLVHILQAGGYNQRFVISGRRGIRSTSIDVGDLASGDSRGFVESLIDGNKASFDPTLRLGEPGFAWTYTKNNEPVNPSFQFTLDDDYDIREFRLWSRYMADQGIEDFKLSFRDTNGSLVGDFSGTADRNQYGTQVFDVGLQLGVRTIELVVVDRSCCSSNGSIVEVQFRT